MLSQAILSYNKNTFDDRVILDLTNILQPQLGCNIFILNKIITDLIKERKFHNLLNNVILIEVKLFKYQDDIFYNITLFIIDGNKLSHIDSKIQQIDRSLIDNDILDRLDSENELILKIE